MFGSNQGLLEFVEMFQGTDKGVASALDHNTGRKLQREQRDLVLCPFDGIILAHSNESEWKQFKNNKNNEAFLDRIYIVKVPYCVRVSEEIKIYEKLIKNSSLSDAPCAPGYFENDGAICSPFKNERGGELKSL